MNVYIAHAKLLQIAMADAETPKKICKGRKAEPENPNNYCTCCKASLKILYGNSWNAISTENMFRPLGKKDFEGEILLHLLQNPGIKVEKKSSLSGTL